MLSMMASLDHVFPFQWPAGLPLPAAYYWFADGAGRSLMESVSGGRAAGSVVYEASDQPTRDYPGANWLSDPHFGSVIGCGSMETGQKDTLQLADVAYGASGAFTINLWLRNPRGSDFAGREREQLFGHGNASLTTSSRNQVHVQLENSGRVRTIVTDSTDVEHEDGASTDTDPATGVDLDDGAWHMYTLTTRPDGRKGYTVYIDAEARAASPFVAGLGVARPTADGAPPSAHGGAPIDPVGTMRLCGRAKPGEWTGEAGERFDDERYFMGALSHFAVFGAALRDDQVAQLRREYVRAFGLDVDRASAGPGDPTAVAFAVVSSLALAALLVTGLVGRLPASASRKTTVSRALAGARGTSLTSCSYQGGSAAESLPPATSPGSAYAAPTPTPA